MSEEFKVGYYYLHTNSQIIHVEFDEVDWVGPFAYFNRPYVVTWGMVQCREDYNTVMTRFKDKG